MPAMSVRCVPTGCGLGAVGMYSAALSLCLILSLCVQVQADVTTRVSVATGGQQANPDSTRARISGDGRYVAFESGANNLVPRDTNHARDIFAHDRVTGQTTRVSVGTGGGEANGNSYKASISADGRYVAFFSNADNLVRYDTNGSYDVFVHDRVTGQTTRVSVGTGGGEANGHSESASISADGRYVAFESDATNLVLVDMNVKRDIFVHDRVTRQTTRVSVATGGWEANHDSLDASISADGRYVAFHSIASNLVPADMNGVEDVFVHDRVSGQTTRVSVAMGGGEGEYSSKGPSISADGRYVAFYSLASNLVPGDTLHLWDIFVHDRMTGQTARVSVPTVGGEANGTSLGASISADGRYVAFESGASNLVPGDTNDGRDVFLNNRFAEPGDLNSDGVVDSMDLYRFILAWWKFTAGDSDWDRAADLYYDGKLTTRDADLMVEAFIRWIKWT